MSLGDKTPLASSPAEFSNRPVKPETASRDNSGTTAWCDAPRPGLSAFPSPPLSHGLRRRREFLIEKFFEYTGLPLIGLSKALSSRIVTAHPPTAKTLCRNSHCAASASRQPGLEGELVSLQGVPVHVVDAGFAAALAAFPWLGRTRRLRWRVLVRAGLGDRHCNSAGSGSPGNRRLTSASSPSASAVRPSRRSVSTRSTQAPSGLPSSSATCRETATEARASRA